MQEIIIKIEEILNKKEKVANLSNFMLSNLPPEITKLKNIKSLFLCKNKFEKFPSEITKLKKIKTLDLGKNNLSELPIDFENLNKLECLDCNCSSEYKKINICVSQKLV